MNYTTKPGAHSSIRINVLEHLPEERYLAALQRVRDAIAAGRPLQFYDDTTPGDKSTSCSWGLCHDSKDTWPDAQDHLFPSDFENNGRISPLPSPDPCPMDTRGYGPYTYGCFYSCRVFQATRKNPRPTHDEALALYEAAIKKHKA
jgi:hypothetical protein